MMYSKRNILFHGVFSGSFHVLPFSLISFVPYMEPVLDPDPQETSKAAVACKTQSLCSEENKEGETHQEAF